MYLLGVLAEQKIRVPEEIALIGFDDFDLAGVVSPPLTTVAQSPVELARRSMALLMTGIYKVKLGAVNSPAKVMLPTQLIVRSSCGPHDLA
jgi:LacI family transcriptional regulator